MFKIETLSNRVLKGTAFVTLLSYIVVDAEGNPVVAKAFQSEAEAQAQIDALGNFSEGLAFAKAQFPGQADKAQKGKAAIVAAYLDWAAAGRPVKTVEEAAAEEAPAVDGESAPAEPELSKVEEF